MKYLAITLGYWGRGSSIQEAIKNNPDKKKRKILLYSGSDDLSIDNWGYVSGQSVKREGWVNRKGEKISEKTV